MFRKNGRKDLAEMIAKNKQTAIDQFVKLREQGYTVEQTARITGYSAKTVQNYLTDAGATRKKKDFSQYRSEVIRLFKEGKTTREIAKITGLSHSCVGDNLRNMGLYRYKRVGCSRIVEDLPDEYESYRGPLEPQPVRYKVNRFQIGGKEYVDDLTPYILYPSEKIMLEY